MLTQTAWPIRWLFFRACVGLKQVMAAKKRPPARRVRKGIKLRAIAFLATGFAAANTVLYAAPAAINVSDQAGALKHGQIRPIGQLSTSIDAPAGELPPDSALLHFGEAPIIEESSDGGRDWLNYAYFWQASALCHRPTYLEERNVERAGWRVRYGLQPAVSAAHFFAGVGAIPVRMALERPWNCEYTLGLERPGSSPSGVDGQ